MNLTSNRDLVSISWIRSVGSIVLLVLVWSLVPGPLAAQYGAIGLSAVRAKRFADASLGGYPPHDGDRFGLALAAADFNGDGLDDLASGAPGSHNFEGEQPESGVVFAQYSVALVGLAGGGPGQVVTQAGNPDPPELGDYFGAALAACDFTGDGRKDLAIGIPFENLPGGADAGAVQIHLGSLVGLTAFSTQNLAQGSGGLPGSAESADYFGAAIACGDFDGDGFADLAIGAPDENLTGTGGVELFGAGTVIVLRGSAAGLQTTGATEWHQDVAGMDDVAESFDYFGSALATGDFDGDGFADLAVGVPGEDNPVGDVHGRGAVHVIFGSAGGLSTTDDYFRVESALGGNSEIGDHFGEALAAGDFDGDGFDDLAIAAPDEDLFPAVDAGQVAAIYGSASGFVFARTQFWSENNVHGEGLSENGDRFGAALAAGDFDGDGRDDLAIGHPGEFVLVPEDGVVTVVMGTPAGLSNARRYGITTGFHGFPGIVNQANRGFGAALAAGDFDGDGHTDLVIAAPGEDEGGLVDAGAEVVLYGSLFSDGLEVPGSAFWSSTMP